MPKPLPEFERPPVNEVALSVSFSPLEGWQPPYAGVYWGRIKSQYPDTQVQPPISTDIEKYGDDFWRSHANPALKIQVMQPDMGRYWFLSRPATNLIQLQRDRFVVNWRQIDGTEIYPRYELELKPRFQSEWREFCAFLDEQGIPRPRVLQAEVTYVNILKFDEAGMSGCLDLFSPWWGGGSDGFLPCPETINFSGAFRMPEQRGRLYFAAQHARRNEDQVEAIQFKLTARGRPEGSDLESILQWMDMGRDWIVRGFADLTSEKAHKLWGRIR